MGFASLYPSYLMTASVEWVERSETHQQCMNPVNDAQPDQD